MKKINSFTNRYALSKTLQFSLIPEGKTEENFNNKLLLQEDEQRAENYSKLKKYIDRYHKEFIETTLSEVVLERLDDYSNLYFKQNKDDKDKKDMEDMESNLRKSICKSFTNDERYKGLFGKNLIQELLLPYLTDEEKEIASQFNKFTTYFRNFNENRKNIYTAQEKSTAVAYRCINDNLPKFLDNAKSFMVVKERLPSECSEELNKNFEKFFSYSVENIFNIDYFSFVLRQSDISKYNQIIGGYSLPNATKVKGFNEYINAYNQKLSKNDKRLPLFKPLFKQILSETESFSFIPEKFEADNELLNAVNDFYLSKTENGMSVKDVIIKIKQMFDNIDTYDEERIFIKSGIAVKGISKAVFSSWCVISDLWAKEYEKNKPRNKKSEEKYNEELKKAYKAIKSFSIFELQQLADKNSCQGSIIKYFKEKVNELCCDIYKEYSLAEDLLSKPYEDKKKLYNNEEAITLVKKFLDSIKAVEHFMKPLLGTGKEEDKDNLFYGEFLTYYSLISQIDRLYDKVRNYMTQKPYSKDKIKLNFENSQFLDGWDIDKESVYRSVLLRKNGNYYLAVMDKTNNRIFENFPESKSGNNFEKIDCMLLPGPNKMLPKVCFAAEKIKEFSPSEKILEIREKETFKKGSNFKIDDCHALIDFYKKSIARHEKWSKYNFNFKPTDEYSDIGMFYNDVKKQGYIISFRNISADYIDDLINSGALYLFRIYNKDFSEHSKGIPNLHTMYFKMLFDERNLDDVIYKLNGNAEMFYRKASISKDEKVIHSANNPIKNKNSNNPKKESVFEYELIKDKRFTKRQFSIHIPISLNFKAEGSVSLNYETRKALKECDKNHIIGIDRGERNLLYVCVINSKGEIVEQYSLNEIINEHNKVEYKVDYHELLDKKEEKRDKARSSWTTVENIKQLKEGYLGQVVNKICKLVVKYDAIIALEDLNSGFKNSRIKVEKQVYQKFEKMLTNKLNYLIDKKLLPEEKGGILNAYQLTNQVNNTKRKSMQDGFIFYIPPWNTSNLDPVTGFVNLFNTHYTSVSNSLAFFSLFDSIKYNSNDDLFEFTFDYANFPRGASSYVKLWTVCSNGDRIRNFRNEEKNNEWDNDSILLTDEFKKLFTDYNIDYFSDIKTSILKQTEKDFFTRLFKLFSLMLQMRNSITGNREVDFIISPVRDSKGEFFDSRKYENLEFSPLPINADANGAYNIARKALWAVDVIKQTPDEELKKAKLSITNKDWLKYTQEQL